MRTKRGLLRKFGLVFAATAVLTAVALAVPRPSSALVYSQPFAAAAACTASCYNGSWICDDPNRHIAEGGGSTATEGAGLHPDSCLTGVCVQYHPCTEVGFVTTESLEQIRKSLAAGKMEPAAALIARHSKFLSVSTDRSALQVKNCSGRLVAHLPINSAKVAQLSEQITRIQTVLATQ